VNVRKLALSFIVFRKCVDKRKEAALILGRQLTLSFHCLDIYMEQEHREFKLLTQVNNLSPSSEELNAVEVT
jgi:hypothetical protein